MEYTIRTMKSALVRLSFLVLGLTACVPKTTYQDQEAKLKDSEAQLKSLEQTQEVCDPDTMIQLREQTQSLDVLTQELVERNTQLSNEVGRLRPFEARFRDQEMQCKKQGDEIRSSFEGQLQRTKVTYEDLIKELQAKVKNLQAELDAKKAEKPKKSAPKASSAPKPPAAAPKAAKP